MASLGVTGRVGVGDVASGFTSEDSLVISLLVVVKRCASEYEYR